MVGIVVLAPMTEDHVRPCDAKRLDKGVPGLDRIDQELVVKVEPDQFSPDDSGGVCRLLMPDGGDFGFRKRRGADVAVGRHAKEHLVSLLGIEGRRTAAEGLDVVRMSTDK